MTYVSLFRARKTIVSKQLVLCLSLFFQGNLCADIDECALIDSCHENATCSNSYGNYTCSCNVGYYGNGISCKKGQCDDRQCFSGQKCVLPTSDECACQKGFALDTKEDFCMDIDECLLDHD